MEMKLRKKRRLKLGSSGAGIRACPYRGRIVRMAKSADRNRRSEEERNAIAETFARIRVLTLLFKKQKADKVRLLSK